MRSPAGALDQTDYAGGNLAVQRQFVVASLWAVLALAITLAALFMARRLGGAFQSPLSGSAIVLASLVTELALFAFRQAWSAADGVIASQCSVLRSCAGMPSARLVLALTSLLAVIFLASLTLPGTPLVGVLIAWLVVLVGEAAQWHFHLRPMWVHSATPLPPPISVSPQLPTATVAPPVLAPIGDLESAEPEAVEPEIPAGLLQQITRVVEGDRESIHAIVQASIAGNDRLAVVHLAFCPPLADKPELTAHALDADDADIRITQAETFGARLEVRLPAVAAVQRSVLVEVLGSVFAGTASSLP